MGLVALSGVYENFLKGHLTLILRILIALHSLNFLHYLYCSYVIRRNTEANDKNFLNTKIPDMMETACFIIPVVMYVIAYHDSILKFLSVFYQVDLDGDPNFAGIFIVLIIGIAAFIGNYIAFGLLTIAFLYPIIKILRRL